MLLWEESKILKTKKMKKNNKLILLASTLVLIYLIFDIFHFFIFRIDLVYPTFTEAFFESSIISYIKWFFCLVILTGFILDKKNSKLSFYLMFLSVIGIILLFILKGQLSYLIRGSFIFKIGLLELASLLILIYSIFSLVNKYKIKILNIVLCSLLAIVFLWYLFAQLPVYNAPY